MTTIQPAAHPQWLLVVMIILATLPFLVMCCTCYLKVSIVINLLKGGLGFSSGGTMAIEFALSAALVALIMHPIATDSIRNLEGVPPLPMSRAPQWSDLKTLEPAVAPWRTFLVKQTGAKELAEIAKLAEPKANGSAQQQSQANQQSPESDKLSSDSGNSSNKLPPLRVLFAAFVLSELKGALVIGIMVLIPFLLVDLLIANTLTALGLTMVSPVAIALPCKLLLFYGCDGWILISRTLMSSY
jgi:type III secretion protein R